jgi:hypothetical protein
MGAIARSLEIGLLERVSVRGFLVVAAVVLTPVTALGSLVAFGVVHSAEFDLDGELNVPAVVSTLLLLAASSAALGQLFAREDVAMGQWEHRANLFVVVLFGFMAADELVQLHEHAESASAIDWQTLYLPIFAAAAAAVALVLRSWSGQPMARALLVAGSVMWALAQLAEHLEHRGDGATVAGYPYYVLVEEVLEIAGSTLFVAAFLNSGRLALRPAALRPNAPRC